MFYEYPKSLYLEGWDNLDASVIVNDSDEEFEARKQGYKSLDEPVDEVKKPKKAKTEAVIESTEQAE